MAEKIPAPLLGKVAVVTGGSRGIGAGVALTMARHGVSHIAITYRTNNDLAEKVLQSMREVNSNIKTTAFPADVDDPNCGKNVVEQALKGLDVDHIDIMVSNAAALDVAGWPPIADIDFNTWSQIMAGEAWTPLVLAREVVKVMPRGGRIILLSSGASKVPNPDPMVPYGMGKAALDSMSRSLAAMYAVKYGVTVNTISIGPTKTDALEAAMEATNSQYRDFLENISPLKRIAEVQEVADIIAFVASPAASWITGVSLPANGGGLSAVQG